MTELTTNRLTNLLTEKDGLLTIYFTAGYPALDDTLPTLEALQASGVDIVEIGIPFSDPIADGPTIQQSNLKALENGMTVEKLFHQLKGFRNIIEIPVLMMSSINPILQYGLESFCKKCNETGIDGLIIPDLPIAEFEEQYMSIFQHNGLINIFLITPSTSESRIRKIDELTEGFIYMVSSSSTTGKQQGLTEEQINYFNRIVSYQLKSKVLTGFGIYDKKSFDQVCRYSNGGIIGSAYIKSLLGDDVREETISFISSIRSV